MLSPPLYSRWWSSDQPFSGPRARVLSRGPFRRYSPDFQSEPSINASAPHFQRIFPSLRRPRPRIPLQRMVVSMYYPLLALSSCLFTSAVHAEVTIYGLFGQTTAAPVQSPGLSTSAAPTPTSWYTDNGPPSFTQLAAYNPVYLPPPPIPDPPPANQFAIGVPSDANLMNVLSIKQTGQFFGFSIEMSVVNQLSECSVPSSPRLRSRAPSMRRYVVLRYGC